MILEPFLPVIAVGARLLPILVVAPIAPLRRVPMLARVILSIALAVILSGTVSSSKIELLNGSLSLLIVSEFVIGASLAFSLHAAHGAIHTVGHLIDMQIGFAAASMFDPSTNQMATPAAQVLTIGMLVTFIQFNVHHDLLIGFSKIVRVVPPGSIPNWSQDWIKVLGSLYVLAFIIVSPVILYLWLIDLTMAFISRALPQAPIYFVGLPFKVGAGLLLLSWFFTQALEPLLRLLSNSLFSWNMMFKG